MVMKTISKSYRLSRVLGTGYALRVTSYWLIALTPLLWRGAGGEAFAQIPQAINYQAIARDA